METQYSLELANAFNDFFTTIGSLLANTIPASTVNPLSYVDNMYARRTRSFFP